MIKKLFGFFLAAATFAGAAHAAGPFTVNTFSDTHDASPGAGTAKDGSGNISLRSAIEEANTDAGTTTINLASGTYNLSLGDLVPGQAASTTIYIHGTGSTIIHQTQTGLMVLAVNENVVANIVLSVDNVTLSGGSENENDPDGFGGNGGAILAGGSSTAPGNVLSLTNVVFDHDYSSPVSNAGASGGAIDMTGGGNLNVYNCTFDSDVASKNSGTGYGGAILFDAGFAPGNAIIQNSTFSNSIAPNGQGGAIYFAGGSGNTYTLTGNTFTGNSAGTQGGAIFLATGNLTGNYNRFIGGSASTATGIYVTATTSPIATADMRNNWWGGNGGPNATGGQTTFPTTSSTPPLSGGEIAFNPWLMLNHYANPGAVLTSHPTTLTATFLTNSASTALAASNLTAMVGAPIAFNNVVNGSLSGAQAAIQASGTATATFNASSTGGNGSADATVDNADVTAPIVVEQVPNITSASSTTFLVGSAGTFAVTKTGFPTPNLNVSGTFPSGVTLNLGTGNLSGTPGVGTGGTYPLVITATNIAGTNIQNFTLTVNQPAAITSANGTTFTAGHPGSFSVTASGFPVPTFSETGTLPAGVSLTNATGVLAGTPAAGTGGTYPITLTAHNGVGSDATQSFTLTVNAAPAITSANATTLTVGSSGSFAVTTTAFPAANVSVSGAMPSGVGFNAGSISGIPGAGTGGTYPLVITATNLAGTNTQNFTLTVNQPAAITSGNGTTFTVGHSGSFTVTASGFPVPTLSESGPLPAGVSFTNANGVLAGTPGTGTGGTYPVTLTAHNGVGSDGTQSFTLTVDQAPGINCPGDINTNSPGGLCQPSISFAASASGFPAPAVSYKLGPSTITSPVTFPLGTNLVSVTATNVAGTDTCSFTVTVVAGPLPMMAITPLQYAFEGYATNRHGQVYSYSNLISVQMSWPANASCFQLQSSTNPLAPWTTVPTGGGTTFDVSIDPTKLSVFYRLSAPPPP